MSDDWRVGDLALCVDDSPPVEHDDGGREHWHYGAPALRIGHAYRVADIGHGRVNNWLGLRMVTGEIGYAYRFRKIRPDEHEDCEPEFATLLESFKPKVDASLTDFVVVVSPDGVASIAA